MPPASCLSPELLHASRDMTPNAGNVSKSSIRSAIARSNSPYSTLLEARYLAEAASFIYQPSLRTSASSIFLPA
ncbi:hypothetical protein OBBRIDRAFT_246483 [Obba rivulosa]|uniref:Uncharacterized protein n=1 Tax=Obba rivulosa TaxID=1052685 RepID=A0A8E2AKJ5_9APHY|nr:hypothetical protein OBBRIDRAFT_246483 [Obba rivulosa]